MTSKSITAILENATQRQPTTSFIKRQPVDRTSTQKESTIHLNVRKYRSGHTSTKEPKEYYKKMFKPQAPAPSH
jgi:hypothetical protein